MNSLDVLELGWKLLLKYNLAEWHFKLDNSKRRFGLCHYGRKFISVSAILSSLNSEAEVRDTILHEIAHALAGHEAGHGARWKYIARAIGCNAKRCYSHMTVATPERKITIECPECESKGKRHRRLSSDRYCVKCYRDTGKRVKIISYATIEEREGLINEVQSVG